MLELLRRRFKDPGWDLARAALPWEPQRPSLARTIEAALLPDSSGLADSSMPLPDDEAAAVAAGLPYVAGGRDGVATFHLPQITEPEAVQAVLQPLRAVLEDGGLDGLDGLYRAMLEHPTLAWVDELGEVIGTEPAADPNRVYALGLLLATQAPDREPVKAGIALLGLLGLGEDELALLRLLGCHDELTLFAAVAVAAASDEAEGELWSMAQRVHGWGRIQAVTRLADSGDPAIGEWLVREGFRNTIDDRYLAAPCAIAGELRARLEELQVDEELLQAAGELFTALLRPQGPVPGIEVWPEGPQALSSWLVHAAAHPRLQPALLTLAQTVLEADARPSPPWPADEGARLTIQAAGILGQWERVPEA